MNTCDYYQELISRLVDGEVSRDEYEDLMNHMNSCSRCNAMYAVFHDLSEILQSEEPEALPEGLHENIMAGVRRSAIEKKNRRLRATWVRTGLTAAACAVLVLFAARGLSPADRTEGNVIRNSEEVQMSAPAQEMAAAAEEKTAPAPLPAAEETAMPVQTAPTLTPSPAPAAAPAQTAAPQATADPYQNRADNGGAQTAGIPAATAAPAATPVPKATTVPSAPAEAAAPETSSAPAAAETAQTPAPAETANAQSPEKEETADAADQKDSAAEPPAALQAAAPAESPEARTETVTTPAADLLPESGSGDAAAAPDAGAVQEEPVEDAVEEAPPSFLKSFKIRLRTPTPALAIPMEGLEDAAEPETTEEPTATEQPAESPAASAAPQASPSATPQASSSATPQPSPSATPQASPSATPAKESRFRLSGKENQKRLTDLLGGTEKALPETEADAIVNITLVPEDPYGGEEELSIRYYGDKVYYVTCPEGKETRSFLADCGAEELKTLIRELRSEKTAASPTESPAASPKATADPFLPDVPECS